jgi:FKBP-type peptidyl-prolyl cis-trans isomerase
MKRTLFLMNILAAIFMMQACIKDTETTDQKKLKENDEQIRQYLSTNNIVAEKTADGLYYQITQSRPDSVLPKTGDQLYMHYVSRLLDGTVFFSTDTVKNEPVRFAYNDGTIIRGFNIGIGLVRKGERARFFIPSYLAYGNSSPDPKVPAYSVIVYDVNLVDILTEDLALQKFIRDNNLQGAVARPSGLYYVPTKAGTGTETAKNGQQVTVSYRGLSLSNKEFDKSTTPWTFILGTNRAIPGFEEGITMMKKGEKATILIPSKLAYGKDGYGSIPPYAPLIFELELLDVK